MQSHSSIPKIVVSFSEDYDPTLPHAGIGFQDDRHLRISFQDFGSKPKTASGITRTGFIPIASKTENVSLGGQQNKSSLHNAHNQFQSASHIGSTTTKLTHVRSDFSSHSTNSSKSEEDEHAILERVKKIFKSLVGNK